MRKLNRFSGSGEKAEAKAHPDPETKTLKVGPHTIQVFLAGKEHLSSGIPSVVFENGLGGDIEDWGSVLTRVAEFAPVVAYDRPGQGGSSESDFEPSPANVADLLHQLLEQVEVEEPFILIGFSLGGPYARMYAARYPEQIAGVVYIDPMDFTYSREARLAVFEEIGCGQGELEEYERIQREYVQGVQTGQTLREWEQAVILLDDGFEEFNQEAPPLDVPQALLCSTREDIPIGEYSFDFGAWAEVDARRHTARMMEWATSLEEGSFVATPASLHDIHGDDPELVVWAIKRVMFPDPLRRLAGILEEKDQSGFGGEYQRLKEIYPEERFGEYLLNYLGYTLLFADKPHKALTVFKLNVEEYPEASNPYDSLGECYMILGETELAIENYAKSLELDPKNINAEHKIEELKKS